MMPLSSGSHFRQRNKRLRLLMFVLFIVLMAFIFYPSTYGEPCTNKLYFNYNTPLNHSNYVVTNTGDLIIWGVSDRYKFVDNENPRVRLPSVFLKDIDSIYVGPANTLALQRDGTLLEWGWETSGIRLRQSSDYIEKIMDHVIACDVGEWSCAAVQTNGDLYIWGKNYGQLGIGEGSGQNISPQKIGSNMKFVYLDESMGFSIDNQNNAYYWGIFYDEKSTRIQISEPQFLLGDAVSIAKIGANRYQILTRDKNTLGLDLNDNSEQIISNGDIMFEKLEEDVAVIFDYGEIKKDHSLWCWTKGSDATYQLRHIANNAISAYANGEDVMYVNNRGIVTRIGNGENLFIRPTIGVLNNIILLQIIAVFFVCILCSLYRKPSSTALKRRCRT